MIIGSLFSFLYFFQIFCIIFFNTEALATFPSTGHSRHIEKKRNGERRTRRPELPSAYSVGEKEAEWEDSGLWGRTGQEKNSGFDRDYLEGRDLEKLLGLWAPVFSPITEIVTANLLDSYEDEANLAAGMSHTSGPPSWLLTGITQGASEKYRLTDPNLYLSLNQQLHKQGLEIYTECHYNMYFWMHF